MQTKINNDTHHKQAFIIQLATQWKLLTTDHTHTLKQRCSHRDRETLSRASRGLSATAELLVLLITYLRHCRRAIRLR